MSTQRCLIVPAADAELAAYLTALASPAGVGMFQHSMGTQDEEAATPTHRFSNGLIADEFAAWLPLDEWDDEPGRCRTSPDER